MSDNHKPALPVRRSSLIESTKSSNSDSNSSKYNSFVSSSTILSIKSFIYKMPSMCSAVTYFLSSAFVGIVSYLVLTSKHYNDKKSKNDENNSINGNLTNSPSNLSNGDSSQRSTILPKQPPILDLANKRALKAALNGNHNKNDSIQQNENAAITKLDRKDKQALINHSTSSSSTTPLSLSNENNHNKNVESSPTNQDLQSPQFKQSIALLHDSVASTNNEGPSIRNMSNHIEPEELARLKRKLASKANANATGHAQHLNANSPSSSSQSSNTSTSTSKLEFASEPSNKAEKEKLSLKRARVEAEFVQSETKYFQSLLQLMSIYIEPLKVKISKNDIKLSNAELSMLIQNISIIVELHRKLSSDLELNCNNDINNIGNLNSTTKTSSVVAIFKTYVSFLRMYCTYVNGYESSIQTLVKLNKNNNSFSKFIKKQRDNENAIILTNNNGSSQILELSSYLVMPIQRVPRYELLFREIIRFTPSSDPDSSSLQSVMEKVKDVNTSINEGKRLIENTQKICDLRDKCSKIPETIELIQPHRRLIRTAQFTILTDQPIILGGNIISKKNKSNSSNSKLLKDGLPQIKTDAFFILFNDALLWLTIDYIFIGWIKLIDSTIDLYQIKGSNQQSQYLEICKGGNHHSSDSQFPLVIESASSDEASSWLESLIEAKENANLKEHSRKQSVSITQRS